MAYGYYTDPGTSFGNTGDNNTQETFIERQRRLQSTSQPTQTTQQSGGFTPISGSRPGTATQPAAGSTGTPVSGNGSIPPPTPAAPAPPAPAAPAPAPAPVAPAAMTQAQREAAVGIEDRGNNLVYVPAYGGVVDRNNNWYTQAMQAAPAAGSGAAVAGGTGTPGTALGGPAEAAKSGMFTQAAAPNHDFENWQQLQMVQQMLANPETMTPQVLEQMKQRSMEEALLGQQQAQQQAMEEANANGFAPNSGRAEAQARSSRDLMMNAILGQNRDLEVQAASQNRADQINALQAAEGILGGQVQRGSQVYGDILAGQNANRGDYWTGKGQDLQKYGIDKGVAVDMSRISSGDTQAAARLAEDARQSNNQMGFNWAQLGQNGQNAVMQAILGTLR